MAFDHLQPLDAAIVGAGAAGYFAGLRLRALQPEARVALFEKTGKVLEKVRISGGGRCNVTHACFEPRALSRAYPRGRRELLGPFHRFQPGDMIAWLEDHGVPLHTEADGRMFPTTNRSASVVECFQREAQKHGLAVHRKSGLHRLQPDANGWRLTLGRQAIEARQVLLATGSDRGTWQALHALGVPIVEPVPSLFTFRTAETDWTALAGISAGVRLKVEGSTLKDQGPLLITHRGFSGPAVLRLSAWGARELAACRYRFRLRINWIDAEPDQLDAWIAEQQRDRPRALLKNTPYPGLARRLWETLLRHAGTEQTPWAALSRKQHQRLADTLLRYAMPIEGKDTYKEEFVTSGGIDRKAIDFRSMALKAFPGLYAAGEVIDIDAVTGGYNFQAAWTGAWLAAEAMAASLSSPAAGTTATP